MIDPRNLGQTIIELEAEVARLTALTSFECPAFVMGGPGHQSKHACDYRYPHPLDGEHGSMLIPRYEWEGPGSYKPATEGA